MTELEPLAGGYSGETFASTAGGEPVVVRVYAGRSRSRGPLAPELDAAVLRLMRGIVPVPAVLEVRRGDEAHDRPGLLVVERLPGVRADLVLPGLDRPGRSRLGAALGEVLDRLAHVPTVRAGRLTPPDLVVEPWPAEAADLPAVVAATLPRLTAWPPDLLDALPGLAEEAQERLDVVGRTCLVHSDLNPKNVLVDPDTLAVTGVLDWEFAHSGSPYTDLGNLLRFERDPAFTAAVLSHRRDPADPDDTDQVLLTARAADLVALLDLAARHHDPTARSPVTAAADRLLRHLARTRDLGAWPDPPAGPVSG